MLVIQYVVPSELCFFKNLQLHVLQTLLHFISAAMNLDVPVVTFLVYVEALEMLIGQTSVL
jgi:hypothetical protein